MLVLAGAVLSRAERPVQLAFKGGIPVRDWFDIDNSNVNGPAPHYGATHQWYMFGVTGEFKLPKNFRFEVDALFKRVGYDFTGQSLTNPGGFTFTKIKPISGNFRRCSNINSRQADTDLSWMSEHR